jgi:hypothetical protein
MYLSITNGPAFVSVTGGLIYTVEYPEVLDQQTVQSFRHTPMMLTMDILINVYGTCSWLAKKALFEPNSVLFCE